MTLSSSDELFSHSLMSPAVSPQRRRAAIKLGDKKDERLATDFLKTIYHFFFNLYIHTGVELEEVII